MTKLISLFSTSSLLLAGAIVGLSLAACDLGPKKIGEEPICEEGEEKPADDACNSCSCVDGQWACTAIACGDLPEECKDGDMQPAPDGCNTCTCGGGQWACTEIGCEEPQCMPGDVKMQDCNTCECAGDGTWSCTKLGCVPGECTPGQQKLEDCNACDCTPEGTWACDTQECPAPECGNGIVDAGEQCDDGNAVDDDECSNACVLSGVQECVGSGTLTVDNAVIVGDELVVDVSYGGGCETHDIGLCWGGEVAESFPVQIWVDLSHDAHGDACDAFVMEQRKLDLVPIKTALMNEGQVAIHLNGWGDVLLYTF
ncbi:DUF4215 domain-containing protein [Nannocystis sp.]|uniref:DUF4215 domain-containing protein n=1 Tax=Nannocystis sp. TaxID=1962667 RepID=UPI0025D7600F|nr:DUF4215 domain-containing protein [Nannocystis sp.]